MVDTATEEELFFPMNRWLGEDRDDGQLHRECAIMSPGVAPQPGQFCVLCISLCYCVPKCY